jgi:hypothetical protein
MMVNPGDALNMSIDGSRSISERPDLKRSFLLGILIAGVALGLGACSSNRERAPNSTAAAPGSQDTLSPLKDLKNLGKNTAFSIDIINAQPIPKSGPMVIDTEEITMGGWAVDQPAQNVAGGVYVTVDGKTDVPTLYGTERPDVATAHNNPSYRLSGFAASILTSTLDKGRHTLGIKILTADRRGYYEPDQKIEIDVR